MKYKNTTYTIVNELTVEEMEADGHPNSAKLYRDNGITGTLTIKRPNGRCWYSLDRFADGTFGNLTKL